MDQKKLKIKIEHLSEHNKSHAEGYRKLADQAGNAGLQEVKDGLLSAAKDLDRAGIQLERVLENL